MREVLCLIDHNETQTINPKQTQIRTNFYILLLKHLICRQFAFTANLVSNVYAPSVSQPLLNLCDTRCHLQRQKMNKENSQFIVLFTIKFPISKMLQFFVLLSFIAAAFATYGCDVSQATSQSSFSCLKNNGYNFAIVRVYRSSGSVDPNGPSSINNAWNGGMAHVDGYIFPCYSCGNPAKQVWYYDTILYILSYSKTTIFCFRSMIPSTTCLLTPSLS